ncbi:hypothetical protein BQ8794_230063 [Mesorhizobium prunaredense]|uniref:Uncharacterized protein n=1 Tax=Mesorhizobium prunaredense TaxID=1631249 RepID=A0A1R3V7A4_9HYPH|nr:hypothetical protein BQ8794_230063 [Mesorhizobium prunaredense]
MKNLAPDNFTQTIRSINQLDDRVHIIHAGFLRICYTSISVAIRKHQ